MKTKERKKHLILTIAWLIIGLGMIFNDSRFIFSYGYIAIALIYLGVYLFKIKNKKNLRQNKNKT